MTGNQYDGSRPSGSLTIIEFIIIIIIIIIIIYSLFIFSQ